MIVLEKSRDLESEDPCMQLWECYLITRRLDLLL